MKKNLKQMDEETRNFLIVVIAVTVVVGLFFLLTTIRLNQPYQISVPPLSGDNQIQFNEILMGSVFNMPEEAYFVFVYDDKNPVSDIHRNLLAQNQKGYRFYEINLNSFFNKSFYGETTQVEKDNLEFTGNTIILIEDGEVKEVLQKPSEIMSYFEE